MSTNGKSAPASAALVLGRVADDELLAMLLPMMEFHSPTPERMFSRIW
jgi:hypothetical protein